MKRGLRIFLLIALPLLYMGLAWWLYAWLEIHSAILEQGGKMKVSDYVSAVVAVAVAIASGIGAVLAFNSLRFTQKAEQGQLYLDMMKRYASPEMRDALRLLGRFRDENKGRLKEAFREWKLRRDNNNAEAKKIEDARHAVKYFYRDLMQLCNAGYFSRKLTKQIMSAGGRYLFLLVLEMEEQANSLEFEKEFHPFHELFKELNSEQKLIRQTQKIFKKVCLIPARFDSTRFDGKLMKRLGDKTVIRATYEQIASYGLFDEVAVVTNSLEIKKELEDHGGQVLYFNKEHNSGTDRIAQALDVIEADIIVNVQGDEPFVPKQALEDILKVVHPELNPMMVASMMRPMDRPDAINSSDFVKVVSDMEDFALYFSRSVTPFPKNPERKADYYEHIGVYAFTKFALQKFVQLPPSDLEIVESIECLRFLENRIPIKMVRTDYHVLEIDTQADLDEANRKLAEGSLTLVPTKTTKGR